MSELEKETEKIRLSSPMGKYRPGKKKGNQQEDKKEEDKKKPELEKESEKSSILISHQGKYTKEGKERAQQEYSDYYFLETEVGNEEISILNGAMKLKFIVSSLYMLLYGARW